MVGVIGAAAEAGVVEGVLVAGADDGVAGGEGQERARGEARERERLRPWGTLGAGGCA